MGIDEKLFPLACIDCIGGYSDGGGRARDPAKYDSGLSKNEYEKIKTTLFNF